MIKEFIFNNTIYPECPIYCEKNNCLFFVDYIKNQIININLNNNLYEIYLQLLDNSGPSGLAFDNEYLYICLFDANKVLQLKDKVIVKEFLIKTPNDIIIDNFGIYVTSSGLFDKNSNKDGCVYWICKKTFDIFKIMDNIHFSNGITILNDNKLIVAEHLQNKLLLYNIISPGNIKFDYSINLPYINNEELIGPDGLVIDKNNNLWIAHFSSGNILKYSFATKELKTINISDKYVNVTNICCDKNNNLYITTFSTNNTGAILKLSM